MSIEIYAISGSPSSWRVTLALAFKQLDYQVHYIDFSKQENKTETYLALNPRGTVPTLVAGNTTIRDSIAIIAWLERVYPDKPLLGTTADEAAVTWQQTMDSSEFMRNANKALLLPIFFKGVKEKNDELLQAADQVRVEFNRLEVLLEKHNFIVGNTPSAADAVCFPEARMVKRALDTHNTLMLDLGFKQGLADFPKLAAWLDRVEAVEGVGATMPPHWG